MSLQITRIDLGIVNCYLIACDKEFFLIDSGFALRRKALEGVRRAASRARCAWRSSPTAIWITPATAPTCKSVTTPRSPCTAETPG